MVSLVRCHVERAILLKARFFFYDSVQFLFWKNYVILAQEDVEMYSGRAGTIASKQRNARSF
jgi:hypothetical protein